MGGLVRLGGLWSGCSVPGRLGGGSQPGWEVPGRLGGVLVRLGVSRNAGGGVGWVGLARLGVPVRLGGPRKSGGS